MNINSSNIKFNLIKNIKYMDMEYFQIYNKININV